MSHKILTSKQIRHVHFFASLLVIAVKYLKIVIV